MPYIRWSERASLDLMRVFEFLALKSRDAALRAVEAIRLRVKTLGRHPQIGRGIEQVPREIRELVVEFGKGGYLVQYEIREDRVIILRIRHGAEDGYGT